MASVQEQSKNSPAADTRPTRQQCYDEAGMVLALALKLYVPASATQADAA